MQQLDEPFRDENIFDNLSFFNSSVLSFKRDRFFWQDPGIQNVADPTDPNPNH